MNFLVDAQLPPKLCGWLKRHGHKAVHVGDIEMLASSDAVIAAEAMTRAAVLISKDEDFLILQRGTDFRFLWLRCGNCTSAALFAWLDRRWSDVEDYLGRGEYLIELR